MTSIQIETQLVAAITTAACALPGVFLVLRRLALLSDAVSHTILLGIVLAYFAVQSLASPLLILAATLTGVLTVSLVEVLHRTGRVREDAAIGLVYPVLFSIAVILISRYLRDVHFDTECVLGGDLVWSIRGRRLLMGGHDLGPQVLYVMLGILILNVLFIVLFFKELKLATFDPALAAALGLSPALIHYALMTLVSVTVVGAFDAVGSILVVALMIAPPVTAYLMTDRLSTMLWLSALLGGVGAVAGYWLAHWLEANIAGAIATVLGLLFAVVWMIAPERGLAALLLRRFRQRWEFAQTMLAIHLFNHENLPEAERESRLDELHEHLQWSAPFVARVVGQAERRGLVLRQEGHLALTPDGRQRAQQAIVTT